MDNLEKDVREAMRLGYGVHYGRYKADHPHTAVEEEEPEPPKYPTRKCKECEQEFIPDRPHQQFCSEECRGRKNARISYHRREKVKLPIGQAICPVCGGEFYRKCATTKYCGQSCAATARNLERYKKVRAMK